MTDYGSTNHGTNNQRAAVQAALYFAGKRRRKHAQAVLTFTEQPGSGKTVTIGAVVYTFGSSAGQVPIGSDLAGSIQNLTNALAASGQVTTPAHDGTTITVRSFGRGFGGTGTSVATNVTGATWSSAKLALPDRLGF